jgi:tetratricopeptide (TPR) repeat protein
MSPQSKKPSEESFDQAAEDFDLQSLKADIEKIKQGKIGKPWIYLKGAICGYSYEEIAKKCKVAPKTVGVALSRDIAPYLKDILNLEEEKTIDWQYIANLSGFKSKYGLEKSKQENVVFETNKSVKKPNNTPLSSAVEFVGRSQQLLELHQLLQKNDHVVITAISGMGGIGKTELAIEYAKNYQEDYQGGICWLHPKQGNIGVQIVEFTITQFNLIVPNQVNLANQVQFCWRNWIEGQVLIVIDDVVDYKQIQPYLPSESQFKILITTRERLSKPLVRLDLDVLKSLEALNLLKLLVGRERLNKEALVARKICQWLGYLPLAIELVGHYLAQDEYLSLAELLKRLEKKRLRHPALKYPESTMRVQLGVADAFELSWELLDENTQKFACFLSLYALAPIPLNIEELKIQFRKETEQEIQEYLSDQSIIDDILDVLQDSFEEHEISKNKLVRLNIMQSCGQGNYRFHQLIREFLRDKLELLPEAEFIKRLFTTSIANITSSIPNELNFNEIKRLSILIPHVEEVIKHLIQYLENNELCYSFEFIINWYKQQGLYSFAEFWCRNYLNKLSNIFMEKTELGTLKIKIFEIKIKLAELIRLKGNYDEANNILFEILEESQNSHNRHLNDQELDSIILTVQIELALICYHKDNLSETEFILNKSLETIEKMPEEERNLYTLKIISIQNNLGLLYTNLGIYDKAEQLLITSLKEMKKIRGVNHHHVAIYQNNLADLYKSKGNYKKAEKLFLNSLEIIKSSLGYEHPNLAHILSNLGDIYRIQGNLDKAQQYFEESLTIRKKILGTNHRDYASSLNELGLLLVELGDYKKAKETFNECLIIQEMLLGKNTSDYARTLNNLGIVYFHQKELDQAENLYLQSLQIRINILGQDHPEVAMSYHNLSDLYFLQHKLHIAEKYSQKSFNIALNKLGIDHPDTQTYQRTLQALYIVRNNPQIHQARFNDVSDKAELLIEKYLNNKKRKQNKTKGFGNIT